MSKDEIPRRRAVQLVHGQDQRPAGGGSRQDPEGGQPDGDGVGRRPAEGQRRAEVAGEVAGEVVELGVERAEQGEERGEAQLDVGGPALGGEHEEALLGGVIAEGVEQRRLAEADCTDEAEGGGPPGGRRHGGALEPRQFGGADEGDARRR